ncbi:MAG: septum site-determining protein MinC [Cyanobacteriota bacterium ELA615]
MSSENSGSEFESISPPQLRRIELKQEGGRCILTLPNQVINSSNQWQELWQELKYFLQHSDRKWSAQQSVLLQAGDHLLDSRQLQNLADILKQFGLQLAVIKTSRRQTAVAAATAGYSVEQFNLLVPFPLGEEQNNILEPLYLKATIRSGVEIRHNGTVIVLGDVNPGSSVVARGDIIIWGHLRGVAHAGSHGEKESRIFALKMEPTQVRIADTVARVAPPDPDDLQPEIAYLTKEGIALSKAFSFEKNHEFQQSTGYWLETVTEFPKLKVEIAAKSSILNKVLKSPLNLYKDI